MPEELLAPKGDISNEDSEEHAAREQLAREQILTGAQAARMGLPDHEIEHHHKKPFLEDPDIADNEMEEEPVRQERAQFNRLLKDNGFDIDVLLTEHPGLEETARRLGYL